MTILQINNLKKLLDGKEVLKDINLTVKKGEILGIVGPSGSGKSTLLKCINRITEIDDGEIKYHGKNINEINPVDLRRNIVLVFQESAMFPGSVYDNLIFGPTLKGSFEKSLIIKCLKDAGLSEEFLQKEAEKLSGGEKQRVALARALALDPMVLLLDEPTSGVDPRNIKNVEKKIINFSKNRKLTILWITHNVDQAKRVSNRIANLKDGMIKNISLTHDFSWEGAY